MVARTVSNKMIESLQETQQCPCSSRPQDISQTIQFLYAFHLEGVRIRVRLTVELGSMLKMLVVAKLMVPACSGCCWKHATKVAEGSTLAKGCARDRGAASCIAAEVALVQIVCGRGNLCRVQKEDEKVKWK